MPLTKTGQKVYKKFCKEYGKKHGTNFFYAYMREHPGKTKSWHRMRK